MANGPDESDLLPTVVSRLRRPAEIEQQFMCMSLYGAFGIQKRITTSNTSRPRPPS